MAPHSVHVIIQDSDPYTGPTGAGGGNVSTPLVGLWVKSEEKNHELNINFDQYVFHKWFRHLPSEVLFNSRTCK